MNIPVEVVAAVVAGLLVWIAAGYVLCRFIGRISQNSDVREELPTDDPVMARHEEGES